MFSPDELASLRIGGPAIIKSIQNSMQNVLDRMTGDFRAGKTDFLAHVAEYSALKSQLFNLTSALDRAPTRGE